MIVQEIPDTRSVTPADFVRRQVLVTGVVEVKDNKSLFKDKNSPERVMKDTNERIRKIVEACFWPWNATCFMVTWDEARNGYVCMVDTPARMEEEEGGGHVL